MKSRLPRKTKKKLKKFVKDCNKVLRQSFMDEFIWGFSAIRYDKNANKVTNVSIDEAFKLLNK